ncbi:MAG: hypothetical protein SVY53_03095 [Chloroflexota bacterium]|nr:hypothetical protein [Chloroflexota bacterium]
MFNTGDNNEILSYVQDLLLEEQMIQENYQAIQSERLVSLVKHAYDNVDFYRKKYDAAGIRPEDIKSVDDICRLPLVTKEDLKVNFPILANNLTAKDCQVFGTTGSTGSPLKIYRQNGPSPVPYIQELLPRVIDILSRSQGTLKVSTALVTGNEVAENLIAHTVELTSKLASVQMQYLDAHDDTEYILDKLNEHKPNLLGTYPSVLKNLALLCRQKGMTPPQPELLVCSAEILDTHSRRIIGEVFQGDIINAYACTEAEVIALECFEHQGLHIQCGEVILELLEDGKPVPPGKPGRVVVTNLRNMATPIIRYSGLQDVAVLSSGECSCSSKLPILDRVEGRMIDSIVLADGTIIHPFKLTMAMEPIPSLAKFQIIQETTSALRVLVVSEEVKSSNNRANVNGSLLDMVVNNLANVLNSSVTITVEKVEDIPPAPGSSGHALVKCLVNNPS